VGGADKKWKGNFWFCFAASVSEKSSICILALLVALFFYFAARRGASSPRFVIVLASAHTSQPPRIGRSHSLTIPARWLLRVRSVALSEPVVTLKKWIVRGTNKSICACPARPVRAQIPAVFRRYYKTAGIAPFLTHV